MTLAEAEAAYRAAYAEAERLRKLRNRLLREALADGTRPVDLARQTGLTRGRIAQITQTKEPA